MTSPIELTPELIDILKTKRIIVIVGTDKSGKSTEASTIASKLGKTTYVVIQKEYDFDVKLFDDLGIKQILVDKESDSKQKLSSSLKDVKGGVIIFDDFHSATRKTKEYIDDNLLNFLREEKKDLHLILNFHYKNIPIKYLQRSWSILILKQHSGINSSKLGKYLNKKLISTPSEEYCKNIQNYDSVYLLKDGKYFHRNGETNEIIEGEIQPKSTAKLSKEDKEDICNLILEGETYDTIANKHNVSKSVIYQVRKIRCGEDKEYKKKYTKLQKQKTLVKKNGKVSDFSWSRSGINFKIITEKLFPTTDKNGQNIRKNAQNTTIINDIKKVGDTPVKVIGESLYKTFEKLVDDHKLEWVDITIQLAKGRVDITIEMENKQIELEVKNWKETKQNKYITKYNVTHDIKNRFTKDATEKWLFVCGRSANKSAKRLLKKLNINYKRLSYKPLTENDSDRKYQIKKKMRSYVDSWIT